MERALFVPDPHCPVNDKKATAALLAFAKHFKPHHVFVIGDMWDAKLVSKYKPERDYKFTTQDELDAVGEFWGDLRKAVRRDAKMTCLLGNHEHRWEKYLDDHPEIGSLRGLDMEKLLNLQGARIVKYNKGVDYRGVHVEHGEILSNKAGYTPHRTMEARCKPIIMGHSHRVSLVHRTTPGGLHFGMEIGTLHNLNPSYMRSMPNWQHGFGTTVWHEGDEFPRPTPWLIHQGRVVDVYGKQFRG